MEFSAWPDPTCLFIIASNIKYLYRKTFCLTCKCGDVALLYLYIFSICIVTYLYLCFILIYFVKHNVLDKIKWNKPWSTLSIFVIFLKESKETYCMCDCNFGWSRKKSNLISVRPDVYLGAIFDLSPNVLFEMILPCIIFWRRLSFLPVGVRWLTGSRA